MRQMMKIFGIFVFLPLCGVLYILQPSTHQRLLNNSHVVKGEILYYNWNSGNTREIPFHKSAYYRYVLDGSVHVDHQKITKPYIKEHPAGSKVDVHYNAEFLSLSKTAIGPLPWTAQIGRMLGWVFLMSYCLYFALFGKQFFRDSDWLGGDE